VIKTKGFGTEKIEEDLAILFPDANVSRMDLDTTRRKRSYEKIIDDFEQNRIQILVGTQMISKGLDFKNVYVVGIMNADNMLNFPDFRASERSYQLISQVSGRAGRTKKRGKVIIQTSDPDHPIIRNVVNQDFARIYRDQLKERKLFHYPPFTRLIQILLKHYNPVKLGDAAELLANNIRKDTSALVLGPEDPLVNKIQRKYIKIILIKLAKDKEGAHTKELLTNIIGEFQKNQMYRSVQISLDVDPM
jgi:primosomal protein N' (replication factor Y)